MIIYEGRKMPCFFSRLVEKSQEKKCRNNAEFRLEGPNNVMHVCGIHADKMMATRPTWTCTKLAFPPEYDSVPAVSLDNAELAKMPWIVEIKADDTGEVIYARERLFRH